MAANFKKKSVPLSSRGQAVPRGSKLSISNNQLLVSSGVPSLDNIIGEFSLKRQTRQVSILKGVPFVIDVKKEENGWTD